jgi:hypothetical protein
VAERFRRQPAELLHVGSTPIPSFSPYIPMVWMNPNSGDGHLRAREDGNYDLVGNNLPVFFIRDAIKFPDMVHSFKPAPDTNIVNDNRFWDFISLTPESTHMITWLFSDRGTVKSARFTLTSVRSDFITTEE